MRTTLDLPDDLINEAMELTGCRTKTNLIKMALKDIIIKNKIKDIKNYYGQLPLAIDLDEMRNR